MIKAEKGPRPDTLSDGCAWFALYTKPHKEYLVCDVLCSEGVETYLPEVAVVVCRKDRRSMCPFFPQYLFARFDPHDETGARVQWTPGLRRIVSTGGRPVPVPDEAVRYIRCRLEKEVVTEPDSPFKKGQVVRVARGPLEGLEAVFDRRLSAKGRVRVFLKVMSRLVATELDLEDLLSPY
jgi:transcriptional antiterminator RfaH